MLQPASKDLQTGGCRPPHRGTARPCVPIAGDLGARPRVPARTRTDVTRAGWSPVPDPGALGLGRGTRWWVLCWAASPTGRPKGGSRRAHDDSSGGPPLGGIQVAGHGAAPLARDVEKPERHLNSWAGQTAAAVPGRSTPTLTTARHVDQSRDRKFWVAANWRPVQVVASRLRGHPDRLTRFPATLSSAFADTRASPSGDSRAAIHSR